MQGIPLRFIMHPYAKHKRCWSHGHASRGPGMIPLRLVSGAAVLWFCVVAAACGETAWNNPYPAEDREKNILYRGFSERPKHLDPVRSYSSNEYELIGQIYEPPLQYHYLKRPYTLVPLTATEMPAVSYHDAEGRQLPESAPAEQVATSIYEIRLKPGIYYQPHPAFARDDEGRFLYHDLARDDVEDMYSLSDFPQTGTRELVARDYVYQIKRLAHPRLHSPIFGIMSGYIIGLREYARRLQQVYNDLAASREDADEPVYLDLREHSLEGVEVVDRYTYRIRIKGKYPQLRYWLAMPFFAPMPPEADRFYAQTALIRRNITLDWYPVGTGPYMLTLNDPNRRMVLVRNPNFRGEPYPSEGEPEDRQAGLLRDAGRAMPFIDEVVFSLEKEAIPYWNKFLQGYYDLSSITSDSFDQAIRLTTHGEATLTEEMRAKGIHLLTAIATSTYYSGFNMLDDVVGGLDEHSRKLRQAVSIAVDYEEYISIFLNGRGIPAQGPLPPGIFGHREGREGINPYVYNWVEGEARRKPLEEARRLLAEAGYPGGRSAETGEALLLHVDTAQTGPDAKAELDWWRKQLRKLNIQLVVRATDYNRFQDKMRNGTAQIFQWGWNADYPDPENFLFLLHGPNKMVGKHGENAANYDNPEYNVLFEKMRNMENGPRRRAIIDRMVKIVRRDAPWIWGLHPKGFTLHHQWYYNAKPNLMANNTLKYKRIDPVLRAEKRADWNQQVVWPVYVLLALLVVGVLPGIATYIRKEHRPAARREQAR